MRKLLLGSAAVCGLALGAAPAMAGSGGVTLELGGHMKGYVAYVDQETTTSTEERNVDILRDTEIHFTGETTLDNGLTVGAHFETEADRGDSLAVQESYAYFSGSWGRVNFGAEDGAAYLLQIAAPSADSNVDGIRQFIQPVNYAISGTSLLSGIEFDYDQNVSGYEDKITYLTPVFSGFQLGASYTPDLDAGSSRGQAGVTTDDVASAYGEVYEGAIRYEGMYNSIGVAVGGGFTHAALEKDGTGTVLGVTGVTLDDRQAWNVGLDLNWGAFGIGAIYTRDDLGAKNNYDEDKFVVGVDYTQGPFKIGASYLNQNNERGTTGDIGTDRYTGGVVYTYGPGMTFRGSVSYIDHSVPAAVGPDVDGTSVLLGTQINF